MSITLKMVDKDLAIDSGGRHINVRGVEKAAQDLAESLMNNYNPEFPTHYIGSTLYEIQGNPIEYNLGNAEIAIRSAVEDAVARLQDLQDEDPYIDDDERITDIARLEVIRIGETTYAYFLECRVDTDELLLLEFDVPLGTNLPPSAAGETQIQSLLDQTSKLFL